MVRKIAQQICINCAWQKKGLGCFHENDAIRLVNTKSKFYPTVVCGRIGNLRSYDGCCNENVTLKLNWKFHVKWQLKIVENFTLSFGRLHQNIASKIVPHVQHDYFPSFNESNHWFVVLSLTLPSWNLKLTIIPKRVRCSYLVIYRKGT